MIAEQRISSQKTCFNFNGNWSTSGDRVLAVAGMNRDQEMAAAEELIRLDQIPTVAQLKKGSTNFLELLKTVAAADATIPCDRRPALAGC